MACAPEYDVTEQAREKVAQGHPCVVTEHVGKFCGEVCEPHARCVLVHHKPLELVYLGIVAVHL